VYKPNFKIVAFLAYLTGSPASAGDTDIVLKKDSFRHSVCSIKSMTVEFSIMTTGSEPLIRSRMNWQAGPNTASNCLSPLTNIYAEALSSRKDKFFIKLSPRIPTAEQVSGSTSVVSPRWDGLVCRSTEESASCLSADEAQNILSDLDFKTLQVTGDATMAQSVSKPVAGANTGVGAELQIFDNLLSDFDEKTAPIDQIEEADTSANFVAESPEEIAEEAVRQVSSLLATSLAQYATPPHKCESERRISNWVRISSTCQISFRRESNHNYLCTKNNKPKNVLHTEKVDVDFSKDLNDIGQLRYDDNGAAILVLRLNGHIVAVEDQYKVDRWQFVAEQHAAADMEKLQESFTTLREFCENKT
jgi:hypothetical protein